MSFRRAAGFKAPTTGFIQKRGIVASEGFMTSFGEDDGPPVFHLVRGTSQTFDASVLFPEHSPSSVYALVSPPPGVSLVDPATIVADLPFIYTDPGGITIQEFPEGITRTLPTTIRDWFPSDHSVKPAHFVSCFRSFSGAGGQRLFELELIPPSATWSTDDRLESEIMVETGSDGYINLGSVEAAFAGHDSAIAIIRKLFMQGNGAINPDGDRFFETDMRNDGSGSLGVFAYKIDGGDIQYFTAPSGVRTWRGYFNFQDVNSEWPSVTLNRARYDNDPSSSGGAGSFAEFSFSMYGSFRRRTTGSSNVLFKFGDGNTYPRFNEDGSDTYEMNSNTDPVVEIDGTPDIETDWLSGSISYLDQGNATNSANVRVTSSQQERLEQEENTTGSTQGPTGVRMEFGRYDFAEMAVYDQDEDMTRDEWRAFQGVMDSNLAAAIGNVTIAYGAT